MLHPWNEERHLAEMEDYHFRLDERCEVEYQIAEAARSLGKDIIERVEIPRASDLADRTEKLLERDYLRGLQISSEIRDLLLEEDRETTAIQMAKVVGKRMYEREGDLATAVEVGLRVGLAILTEAILVAPLEGISNVRLLNNADGSQFVSVDFCGPIRAAGGTAQALAVLITDVVRRELDIGPYIARMEEVERVKEEFGLYRKNLQYRPSPEEIEMIVKACPIMVNGESTEEEECAGYGNLENVDGTRVRGGVLLVIGEGLCLKAPKVQRHTERLNVEGWEFISHFANKGKDASEGGEKRKSRLVKQDDRFMDDIIAGRPVFGEPSAPGGFRLRYGRTRATGLAAASLSAVTMHALGDFIAVGTQMKIERPGKACAVTPSHRLQGPTCLLEDGTYGRMDSLDMYKGASKQVRSIWDNGELMLGYGEFMENNKNLVPSGYNRDWWAADLLQELIDDDSVSRFAASMGVSREQLPDGTPSGFEPSNVSELHINRHWVEYLREVPLNWDATVAVAESFGTAIPPPWNLNWLDLPLEWMGILRDNLLTASVVNSGTDPCQDWTNDRVSDSWMRLTDVVSCWTPPGIGVPIPETPPGKEIEVPGIITDRSAPVEEVARHGLIKASLMLLGIRHHHDGDDILIPLGWEPLLDGLGLEVNEGKVTSKTDLEPHLKERKSRLSTAVRHLREEADRQSKLDAERDTVRIAAQTAARQRGEGIAATEHSGDLAAAEVHDPGPEDPDRLVSAELLLEDHAIDGSIFIVRAMSDYRWEHNAPTRIGARMARPEKAAERLMKTNVNALFPVGTQGGPQRLISEAASRGNLRVSLGVRECTKCGRPSPFVRCHHRLVASDHKTCGGRTTSRKPTNSKARRQGEFQTIPLTKLLESKVEELGIDGIPKMKCVKGLSSKSQTPEPLEKGIIRARNGLPVFRDGTVRFDMSDIPVTHFRPCEIGTPWQHLKELGYEVDIEGKPLTSDEQIIEIFPQDFIPSTNAVDHLVKTCQFVDELLVRFYEMDPYYNVNEQADLIGQLSIALAPHTSGGVLCRIIGFTKASGGYAHTLFHASKRRNCDGDEDCIMMLLDGLLNFSNELLPNNRGGKMDAPLTLTIRLNPMELDKEALNVDTAWFYPRSFYEATISCPHPKELQESMDFVERRVETVGALRGYGYTHDLESLDSGPSNSSYKILETMVDKMNAQIELAQVLRAVDVRRVASSVVNSHFFPDLRGNLLAFTRQKVRCGRCGAKYRRVPLAGKCIEVKKVDRNSSIVRADQAIHCGGNLIMTVSEGAVRKYVKVATHVMDTFGTSDYTRQKYGWLAESLDSLFKNDRVKVYTLDDFF